MEHRLAILGALKWDDLLPVNRFPRCCGIGYRMTMHVHTPTGEKEVGNAMEAEEMPFIHTKKRRCTYFRCSPPSLYRCVIARRLLTRRLSNDY
jgi:hypothetical protein